MKKIEKIRLAKRYTNISRLKDFSNCKQKYYQKWVEGIVPEGKKDDNLVFGTAFHKGEESWYGRKNRWDDRIAIKKAVRSLGKDYIAEDELESREYLELLLKKYFERYREQDEEEFEEIAFVEEEMMIEIAGVGFACRPDMLVKRSGGKSKEGWWHVQTKTMSSSVEVGARIVEYTQDWHERAYALAASKVLGERVRGTVFNGVRKLVPGPVATKKQIEEGVELVLGRRVLSEDWMPFFRSEMLITDADLSRFKRDMEGVIGELERAEESGNWFRNCSACGMWNKTCEYIDPCRGVSTKLGGWKEREMDYVDNYIGPDHNKYQTN